MPIRIPLLLSLFLLGCAGSGPMELAAGEEQETGAPRKTVTRKAEKKAPAVPPAASKPPASKPAGAKPPDAVAPPLSRKPAADPPATEKTSSAGKTGTAEKTDRKRSHAAGQEVAALLQDLANPQKADAAFWKIAEAPKSWIPELINHVEDRAPSGLERIQMLIVDPDFVGESKQFLANRIRGLGPMEVVEEVEQGDLRVVSQEYTRMSYGLARNKKGYRLVMDKFGGFPVGVVIRAGLINRFRGARSPTSSDDDPAPGKLAAWWREYLWIAGAELRESRKSNEKSEVGSRKSEVGR